MRGAVRPREIMFVERYSHVMHLASQITGHLRPEADSYAALAACFPAGTLTGAPKVRATWICSFTRSSPVVHSVTGCSTCKRVFISMKEKCWVSGSYKNSTVPALW